MNMNEWISCNISCVFLYKWPFSNWFADEANKLDTWSYSAVMITKKYELIKQNYSETLKIIWIT
jgi:hypothetical protein